MGSHQSEQARTAEIVAALCLATDLGMGFPLEHGLRATLMAMRIADMTEVDVETARQTYYVSLLTYSGCTTDLVATAELFDGHLTNTLMPHVFGTRSEIIRGVLATIPGPNDKGWERTRKIATRFPKAARSTPEQRRAICEVGEMLSRRLGLPEDVTTTFQMLTERWDGKGVLKRAAGDEVPLALRIALVAQDAALQRLFHSDEEAVDILSARSGGAFDPSLVRLLVDNYNELFSIGAPGDEAWDRILDLEPMPHLTLEDDAIDTALAAIGDFSDLISPSLTGHSTGVADLAQRAGNIAGFSDEDSRLLRRAGWVHDVGRVAVHTRIWEKPEPLSPHEVEQVRLHPYHTERVLVRSEFLGTLASTASNHHEHLDGSGYHRAIGASNLDRRARLLAVADIFHAMLEPRPHRSPLGPETAKGLLLEQVREGHLDPQMVNAVLEAAGHEGHQIEWPAGLTDRETEVLGLLARGLLTKQIAAALGISAKTADTHIQSAYRKIGVSTRAAATLFVMEHGLVPSGELPIPI